MATNGGGGEVQYGQSNNVESARTFSAGTKQPLPESTALKTSAVKQHSDSQSGFKKESPEALIKYRIPGTGPRPTESDSPRKGSVNLYSTPDGSLICKREPISIRAGIPKIDYYSSNNVYRTELTHRVGLLHKYNCLHREGLFDYGLVSISL